MVLDGSTINIWIAFVAGLVAFFAPCVLPLVPSYIGYFAGVGVSDKEIEGKKFEIFRHSLYFSAGFILVFVLLGLSATRIGGLLVSHKILLSRIGGLFMVLLGLYLLDVFKYAALYKEFKIDFQKHLTKNRGVNSFIFGLTFGFAWTPCIGPVLAVILYWASQSGGAFQGMFLLFSFGLGIAVPFILIGLFIDRMLPLIRKTRRLQEIVHYTAGVVMVLFGVLMLIDKASALSGYFLGLFN